MVYGFKQVAKTLKNATAIATVMAATGGAFFAQQAYAMSLSEALVSAYEKNPVLQAQRAGLRAVDETVNQAKSGWRPTVALSADIGYRSADTKAISDAAGTDVFSSTEADHQPRSIGLSVRQNLYDGNGTRAGIAQAEANVSAGRANLVSTEQTILLDAIESYMNVWRETQTLELNINNEKVLERQLQAPRDRFEVGEITRTDVAQAEARLSRAVAQRAASEGTLAISKAAFENVVGVAPDVISFPEAIGEIPASLTDAVEMAVENNPGLVAARESAEATRHAIDVAYANLLPSIDLAATAARAYDQSSRHDQTDTVTATVTVSMPLYAGGATRSSIRQAKQSASQAQSDVESALRDVVEGAASAWESFKSSEQQIRSREEQVRASEIALDGVRQEAAVGSRTTLDVLDAEQELLDAQVALAGAQRDALVARYQLVSSVGGLTVGKLGLGAAAYDPTEHYRAVENELWNIEVPGE